MFSFYVNINNFTLSMVKNKLNKSMKRLKVSSRAEHSLSFIKHVVKKKRQ